jgi:hypothetical protein
MRFNRNREKTLKGWLWCALLGPAQLIDGAIATITVGSFSLGLQLEISRRLAKSRIEHVRS